MNMPERSYEPVHFTLFTICSALNTNSSKPRGCLYDYGHRLTLYILTTMKRNLQRASSFCPRGWPSSFPVLA
jgi:hypothetical protein